LPTISQYIFQVGTEELVNDPTLTRLIDQALAGNREPKILAQDVKDDADEPLRKIAEHKAGEARACASDHLRYSAGPPILLDPLSPSTGAGSRPSAKLQWSDHLGQLRSAHD
jgi:hypothetical protein